MTIFIGKDSDGGSIMPFGFLPHFNDCLISWISEILKSESHYHTLCTFFFEAGSSRSGTQRDKRKSDETFGALSIELAHFFLFRKTGISDSTK